MIGPFFSGSETKIKELSFEINFINFIMSPSKITEI